MCGIVGVTHSPQASLDVFQALLMLQHRGQDSAGILSYSNQDRRFHIRKSLGLVSQVFDSYQLQELPGEFAIGHTRYSTIGKVKEADIQPMFHSYPYGIAAVHNGNISNMDKVKSSLFTDRRYLHSDNDLEALLHLTAKGLENASDTSFFETLTDAVSKILDLCEGGYSVINIVGGKGLFAYRDRFGIRPLVLGKKGESHILTSETNAITFLGYEYVRDINPGELIYIDMNGEVHSRIVGRNPKPLPCMFEWVYFSSAESTWQSKNVYQTRLRLGQQLATKIKHDIQDELVKKGESIDVVAPVPDTSRSSAIALAESMSLPYREVLIKNRYVQRSFILNSQEKRREAVALKFSVIRTLVEGKNILLVDDSIVRGTTSRKLINLVRSYGARKVFLASTCPPIRFPCSYGLDFPKKEDLISHQHDPKSIAAEIGADQVVFTDESDLKKALGLNHFCHACLNGDYPYDADLSRVGEGRL